MSSNNNNKDKKNKPLSASSLCKTASKYTTRSQTADKATSSRQTREPDELTLCDQNIMNQITNVLSEDYNGGDNNTVLPTFDTTANTPHEDKTEYTSKTQTDHSTTSQINIIDTANDKNRLESNKANVKISTIIENKSDPIDINKNSKPETSQ